ncbi:hypothetical protein LWF15_18830 [Kineosporia rhizophila]|uniref:hypothetical protein n=1 Tax=Kineosporia rhizophila TaxID=84633 RepID=UPI001E5D8B08|nr:hypothetical protein [Kineosporia rhizophila]MCE0537547.1 hypothetical protein [Kineosporia rhizophila]
MQRRQHPYDGKRTGRREQVLVTAMAVVAIVAIVTVVVGPWRGEGDLSDSTTPAEPDLRVPRPPGIDTSQAHLIVSPGAVPAEGGEVAVILANPTTERVDFGVMGRLQRWDGATWHDHRQLTTGLSLDSPPGGLHSLQEELMVPAIALGAPAGSFGSPVWTRIGDVSPGWYRIQLGNSYGLIEVGGTPEHQVLRSSTAFGFEGDHVVEAAEPATLNLMVVPRGRLEGVFDPQEQVGDLTGEARIERMDEGRWVVVPSDTLRTRDDEPQNGPNFVVELPALEKGLYRVSREATVAGRVESLFWALPLS